MISKVKEERGRGLPLSLQSLQGSSTVDSGLDISIIVVPPIILIFMIVELSNMLNQRECTAMSPTYVNLGGAMAACFLNVKRNQLKAGSLIALLGSHNCHHSQRLQHNISGVS